MKTLTKPLRTFYKGNVKEIKGKYTEGNTNLQMAITSRVLGVGRRYGAWNLWNETIQVDSTSFKSDLGPLTLALRLRTFFHLPPNIHLNFARLSKCCLHIVSVTFKAMGNVTFTPMQM